MAQPRVQGDEWARFLPKSLCFLSKRSSPVELSAQTANTAEKGDLTKKMQFFLKWQKKLYTEEKKYVI